MALPPSSISVGRLNDRMKRELERKLLVDPLPPNRRQGSRFEKRNETKSSSLLCLLLIRLFDLLLQLFLAFWKRIAASSFFPRDNWLLLLSLIVIIEDFFELIFYCTFLTLLFFLSIAWKTRLEILVPVIYYIKARDNRSTRFDELLTANLKTISRMRVIKVSLRIEKKNLSSIKLYIYCVKRSGKMRLRFIINLIILLNIMFIV